MKENKKLIKQDGTMFNSDAFKGISEEQALKRYPKYNKKTIVAVWKQANGLSEKTNQPEPEKEDNKKVQK